MLLMTDQNQSHVVKAECFKLSTAMAAEIKTADSFDILYLDTWLFKQLLHGFVKVVTDISLPLPNKYKLKFDPNFEVRWLD